MNKVWLVTGANSGIGNGIALAALEAGDRVIATGRNMDKLRASFDKNNEDNLFLVDLDVTDEAQSKAATAKAIEKFGRIDVLVNNAGYSLLGNFEDITTTDIKRQFDTNFYGAANLMQAVLPFMRKQRYGHIINISSVAGAIGFKNSSAYCASKFALEGLTMAVAAEVEQFGINITIVEPGFFRTKFLNANNATFVESKIEDYAHEGSIKEMWSPYDGHQPGDPFKLGQAIVNISNMPKPLTLFVAGRDALTFLLPAAEARVKAIQDNAALSAVTDGEF
jgi:NAD(P)-dependent dehydrogenase (short-subunit alcohol dehydrogenase family)